MPSPKFAARSKGASQGRDIIVVGGSSGAFPVLGELLRHLPGDLPAAIFIVLHRIDPSSLPELAGRFRKAGILAVNVLGKRTALSVESAVDGQPFERGHAYLAPGGRHLLVERGLMRLEGSPKEVYARPSIDVLFRSAAQAYGRRVVGVILSGALYDGTAGLWEVKKRGGIAIVQDPREAECPEMAQRGEAATKQVFTP